MFLCGCTPWRPVSAAFARKGQHFLLCTGSGGSWRPWVSSGLRVAALGALQGVGCTHWCSLVCAAFCVAGRALPSQRLGRTTWPPLVFTASFIFLPNPKTCHRKTEDGLVNSQARGSEKCPGFWCKTQRDSNSSGPEPGKFGASASQMGIQGPACSTPQSCNKAKWRPDQIPRKAFRLLSGLQGFRGNAGDEKVWEAFCCPARQGASGPDSSVDVIVKLPCLFNVKGFGRIFFSSCRKPRQGQLFFCRKTHWVLHPTFWNHRFFDEKRIWSFCSSWVDGVFSMNSLLVELVWTKSGVCKI